MVVLKIPAGNSNKRDITQRKGTRKLNNLNDCFEINTYRKKYHQVNLSGPLAEKSHNTSYNIHINWEGIAGNHKLIDSINKFNILDRIYTMSSKSKAKKAVRKSLGKRTKERVHALNQTTPGTNEAESSEDEEIKSEEFESGSDMETGDELEDFRTYCSKPDFASKEPTFYHIAASIYWLAGRIVAHPSGTELTTLVKEACPNADSKALSPVIEEVLL